MTGLALFAIGYVIGVMLGGAAAILVMGRKSETD